MVGLECWKSIGHSGTRMFELKADGGIEHMKI